MPNEIDTLTQDIKDLTAEVERLRTEQKTLVDSINRETLNAQAAVETTNNLLFQQAGDQKKLQDLNDKIAETESVLAAANARTLEIEKTNQELKIYCDKLSGDASEYINSIASLTLEYSNKEAALKDEYKKASESMKQDLVGIQLEINTVNNQLELSRINLDGLNAKIKDAGDELDKKNSDIESATNTLNSALTSVADAENRLENIKKEIKSGEEKCSTIGERITELGEEQSTEENKLVLAKEETTKQQAILDGIMVKGASLLRREEYLSQQEIYLADQYKRLGLVYQPYAEN